MIGLETAVKDDLYDWRIEKDPTAFERVLVFPDRQMDELSPRLIHERVVETLDRIDPDAVAIHSYSLPDARACLWWCRRHRRTAIMMTDTKEDDAPRVAWREYLKSFIVQSFDAALLAGTPQAQYYRDHLGFPEDGIFLGYDVVDNDHFSKGAEAVRTGKHDVAHLPGLADDTPFFLAIGRFLPFKNLNGLLEAYRRYRETALEPWRLVLVGDGPARPEVEALIARQEIDGVTLTGFRQIDELPAYYGRAGAFVHPTFKDTWALVVNEAMAAGLPVLISTSAGCVQDLVESGHNGFRFDPHDTARLTELLLTIAAPGTDRAAMSAASREIIALWPLDRFADKLWQAVQAGGARSQRGLHPLAGVLLWILQHAATSIRSFQTVEV